MGRQAGDRRIAWWAVPPVGPPEDMLSLAAQGCSCLFRATLHLQGPSWCLETCLFQREAKQDGVEDVGWRVAL